jgi:SAM-dependent methyltransferase
MFKKDIDKIKELHAKYSLKGPLLDAGGLESPTIADYEISANKALDIPLGDGRVVKIPHSNQGDRYLGITRPWAFIDPEYLILNPAYGAPIIEDLPLSYAEAFETVITVSVLEHVNNPYLVSDALYKILKPGGYLFTSTPFIFPYHPSPEDNFRYSPLALKRIHEQSGFEWVEGDFHINHTTKEGIGDTNPKNYGAPQAIMASYAFCRKN